MKTLDLFRHDFVLSIRPEYATKIINGQKRVELRRRFPTSTVTGAVSYIYATAPIQAIIGWATIVEVRSMLVPQIWEEFKDVACIDTQDFEQYFAGMKRGCVLMLERPEAANPPVSLAVMKQKLKFVPPQSYCYADDALQRLVRHD